MSHDANPISKFFATLLHLGLTVIVIGVIITMAKAREQGEDINPVEAATQKTHQIWVDAKKGWSSVNDTINK
jgi:hypothetical protein